MKPSPRLRRWLLIGAGVLFVYAVVGFFVVPWIARGQIEKRATAALNRTVTVQQVRTNPFTLSMAVNGLSVSDRDGGEFASWERFFANFDPLTSLFRWQWSLGEIHLVHPRAKLDIAEDGSLNIADLLTPSSEGPPAEKGDDEGLPGVAVDLLRVERLEFEFSDRSRRTPFHTVAGPLSYEMRDFSTKPGAAGTYSFTGRTNAIERFTWTGSVSVAPIGSKGRVEFTNIALPPQMPLLEELFAGQLVGGRVSLATNYDVSLAAALQGRLEGTTVAVEEVGVQLPDATEPALTWERLDLEIASADLATRAAEVTRVALTGFDLRATRRADGSIDLLSLLPPQAPAPATAEPKAAPPLVNIAEFVLSNGRVTITDETIAEPGTLVLENIAVTARNASTQLDRTVDLDMSAQWGGGGELVAKGTLRPQPLLAALDVEGRDLALPVLQPWVAPLAGVTIASGTQGFRGRIEAEQVEAQPLALTWQGDVNTDKLEVRASATGDALLAWDSLAHTGTRFRLEPLEVSAESIALTRPVVHLAVDESGGLNLQSVLPAASEEENPPPDASTPAAPAESAAPAEKTTSAKLAAASRASLPFAATVGEVTVNGGRVLVNDRSVPGGFTSELRELTGSIRGLSSEELARADAAFTASLEGVAPLEIKGAINPLADDLFSDVRIALHNIDLPWFTPYASKYLGQTIQKGKLNVDLTYRLSQNFLEAENRALLDQFYLGEKVESPDALKLPIGLALAVLREPDGTIPITMPIRGSLDDPDFRYGQLVVQFLSNLFVKAATAPFKMLGGLFGGGREIDISFVDFASGSTEIRPQAADKLGVLRTALENRPALRLEINAPAAPDGDRAGLQAMRLDAQLRAARATPSDAALAPEETESLLRVVFAQSFPAEAAAALPPETTSGSTPTTPDATTAESETSEPGFLKRLARTIFGSEKEEPAAPASPEAATPPADAPPPVLTAEEIRTRLLDTIELTEADFQELAATRARIVREHLLTSGTVVPERIFIVSTPRIPDDATAATDGGRVFFGLQ